MSASLRALLSGIVDYAGLFPPAKLPLDQSIRNYARYRQDPDAWMLGRFICPAARLAELAPFDELFRASPPFAFSALGRGGKDAHEFLKGLRTDLEDIAAFRQRHGERVVVDVFETRLAPEVVQPNARGAATLVGCAAELFDAHGPPVLTPYYEAPFGPDWQDALSA